MKKVLVVENSPTIISVADSLLRQRGYDVTCLSAGDKALEFVKSEKPDLVLTAIGIEGLDGIQLCEAISADSIIAGIPVILLVSDKDSMYADQFNLCGARGIIKKPFSPKELVAITDKYTGNIETKKPQMVDQEAQGGPKLKPKVEPQEIGTSTKNIVADHGQDDESMKKPETVYNIEWGDLKDDPDFMPESKGELSADESGLEIEEDQYGLTKLSDEISPAGKENADEDYDWFVGEMKKEIEGKPKNAKDKPKEKPKHKSESKPDISYDDLEISTPVSKDDAKYRQFLNQFKKDAAVLTEQKPAEQNSVDVDLLVDRVAKKIAQQIVEKLDKNELKRIIGSMLSDF